MFVELMAEAHQSLWQTLPLTPVGSHGSPYSPHSLFAGNPLLLSPEVLTEQGFLRTLPPPRPIEDPERVNFQECLALKDSLIHSAFAFSFDRAKQERGYKGFCERNEGWLDDYALYDALSRKYAQPWFAWPEDIRKRDAGAIAKERSGLIESINLAKFGQFLFDQQWSSLKEFAASKGIRMLGDVPFYVLHDSSDIWSHADLFKVSADGSALFVGGVPPDYFSKTGQRWGNPVYDWKKLEGTGYRWWMERVSRDLALADYLRLDHFRGYVAYWEIPADSPTAVKGNWIPLPKSFLESIRAYFPDLPFVAEDLGVITDDVREAMARLGLPGMRVLQFGFDGSPDNPHFPPNHTRNSLACTGTHDTNTTLGWFLEEATAKDKETLGRYLGRPVTAETVCDDFLKMALSSASDFCVIPFQDLLGLDGRARMNNPGASVGNWTWRTAPGTLTEASFRKLAELTISAGRG
jgi:4-alpha-glucanotransferase